MSSTIKNVLCKTCLILIIGFTFLTASYAHAQQQTVILRVDGDNGTLPPPQGTADGSAWGTTAFKLLQDALAEAEIQLLDPDVDIVDLWVAATEPDNPYRPDRDAAFPGGTTDRQSTFLLDFNNVQLLGGFPPGGGDLEDRDPAVNITVLSGELIFGGCGDPNAGDCFEANGSPNCEDAECCAAVCDSDPLCCILEWDQTCADIAGGTCSPPLPADPRRAYHVVTADDVDGTVRIDGVKITLGLNDGGGDGRGAGMVISNASPAVVRVTFTENSSPLHGGGAMHIEFTSHPLIINCIMTGNDGRFGGAIHIDPAPASATLVNCLISGNTATDSGGGIDARSDSPATLDLINCTVTDNTAQNFGGGIWVVGTMAVTITNSILWGNVPNQITGTATVTYSDVEGGWAGEGNIDEDPLFVDAPNDYRILIGSMVIDKGNPIIEGVIPDDIFDINNDGDFFEPTPDLDLFHRVLDGDQIGGDRVDMGGYEFVHPDSCPWDLDGGGFVGAGDLLLLLASWGNPYGAADLLALLADWGPCPCCSFVPPSLPDELAAACLSQADWDKFVAVMTDPNAPQVKKDRYLCWMEHYLFDCNKCICIGPSGCPNPDPFGS